jgi:diaminopimelate decarboxylase
MEDDILADSIGLPADISIGDRLIIADAGAYERSMSYEFGYGRISPTM